MASILDRYGIKEVADVTFYTIDEATGKADIPVLYLDSLKVSTIEQTAETVYAQGGKGNPRLIGWDFGKEITLSLEDALFSPKSMAVMFGNGTVNNTTEGYTIKKTVTAVAGTGTISVKWTDAKGDLHEEKNFTVYSENGELVGKVANNSFTGEGEKTLTAGARYFCTFDVKVAGQEIVVGPNTFPGTYYITGDTYARSEVTGEDDYFQFIIPKGKITSENTITMEAEGDPSVFNLNVDVLRANLDGEQVMMKLVKYDLTATE